METILSLLLLVLLLLLLLLLAYTNSQMEILTAQGNFISFSISFFISFFFLFHFEKLTYFESLELTNKDILLLKILI